MALTNNATVSALQRGRGAGDGPIGAVLGRDAGADGRQGGAGAAGGRRGRAAGQRGAGADALRHRRALQNGQEQQHITHRCKALQGRKVFLQLTLEDFALSGEAEKCCTV